MTDALTTRRLNWITWQAKCRVGISRYYAIGITEAHARRRVARAMRTNPPRRSRDYNHPNLSPGEYVLTAARRLLTQWPVATDGHEGTDD